MRIAFLEAVTAGLCGDNPGPSLLREGAAMWRAIIEDLVAVPGVEIDTLLGKRWLKLAPKLDSVHIRAAAGTAEARTCWETALKRADQALIIAPESGGCLLQLVSSLPPDVRSWNCLPSAIELCSDKLRLANHLHEQGIATIPTAIEDWSRPPAADEYPCVIKPRDGAGSFLVRRVESDHEWQCLRDEFTAHGDPPAIRQPCIAGKALSIAGWFGRSSSLWFPIAEQQLSTDGRFEYQGGKLPAELPEAVHEAVRDLATQTATTLPGLRGYVGCDILCPDDAVHAPLLVEVNPRFTTSYVGYRRWWATSPWPGWLLDAGSLPLPRVESGRVRFTADGTTHVDHR